jgi:hypothetical protein
MGLDTTFLGHLTICSSLEIFVFSCSTRLLFLMILMEGGIFHFGLNRCIANRCMVHAVAGPCLIDLYLSTTLRVFAWSE